MTSGVPHAGELTIELTTRGSGLGNRALWRPANGRADPRAGEHESRVPGSIVIRNAGGLLPETVARGCR